MPAPSPGSGKWPDSAWKELLRAAAGLVDTLAGAPRWSFGGGTSLAVQYGHRISYDVDLFLADADALHALSPNRNPATKALLGGRPYEYPGNYLKLTLEEGEIDFIVASSRTAVATLDWTLEGRVIRLDTPWETAVKKMFHRPSQFKVRDVFDLAAVIERHPAELAASLDEVTDRLPRLLDRIDRLRPAYARLVREDVRPTADGERYMEETAVEEVWRFLTTWAAEL